MKTPYPVYSALLPYHGTPVFARSAKPSSIHAPAHPVLLPYHRVPVFARSAKPSSAHGRDGSSSGPVSQHSWSLGEPFLVGVSRFFHSLDVHSSLANRFVSSPTTHSSL